MLDEIQTLSKKNDSLIKQSKEDAEMIFLMKGEVNI